MIFDDEKEGLETVFKEWQIAAFSTLFSKREAKSRQIYNGVLEEISPATISIASIIIFMNKMVDLGLVTYRDKSSKGGYTRFYLAGVPGQEGSVGSFEELRYVLFQRFLRRLERELLGVKPNMDERR